MLAKGFGCQYDTPRRIDLIQLAAHGRAGCEPSKRSGIGIEDINETVACTLNIVMLGVILLRKCHKYKMPDLLDIEWSVTGRRVRIGELPHKNHARVVSAVRVNGAFGEICRKQQRLARCHQGDPLVHGRVARDECFGSSHKGWSPSGDCSVFAHKDEDVAVKAAS